MCNSILQVHLISDTVRLLSAWVTFFNMISLLLGHFLLFFPCSSPDSLPDDISCIKADVVVRLTIKALNPVVVLKSCILSKQTTKIYHCWILLRQTFRPEEGLPANTHTHTARFTSGIISQAYSVFARSHGAGEIKKSHIGPVQQTGGSTTVGAARQTTPVHITVESYPRVELTLACCCKHEPSRCLNIHYQRTALIVLE